MKNSAQKFQFLCANFIKITFYPYSIRMHETNCIWSYIIVCYERTCMYNKFLKFLNFKAFVKQNYF